MPIFMVAAHLAFVQSLNRKRQLWHEQGGTGTPGVMVEGEEEEEEEEAEAEAEEPGMVEDEVSDQKDTAE